MPESCARKKGLKIWQNSQPNVFQNSYSDIEMKICSADPNTNHDSMTTMMTVIFVIDVLQQKAGTCHHHHFELGVGFQQIDRADQQGAELTERSMSKRA